MPEPLYPPSSLLALSPAERARTALAACSFVSWRHDDQTTVAPFLEEDGSLLLLVTEAVARRLIEVGGGQVEVGLNASIGVLRLSGEFLEVPEDVARPTIRMVHEWHADCTDCPGRTATHLVSLQVERAQQWSFGDGFVEVDLQAYEEAHPDALLAIGIRLADHLNSDHPAEVREVASILTGSQDLLAARIEWVDAYGLELSAIDSLGSSRVRSDLPGIVTEPEQLASAVHRWLDLHSSQAR